VVDHLLATASVFRGKAQEAALAPIRAAPSSAEDRGSTCESVKIEGVSLRVSNLLTRGLGIRSLAELRTYPWPALKRKLEVLDRCGPRTLEIIHDLHSGPF
jgi:hypothetical protein